MSEPDASARPPARSDEERAAFFHDLMREERQRNGPPVSGFAIATLVTGVLAFGAGMFVGLLGLFWGIATLVFGVAAVSQIRHGERWGVPFVVAGVAIVVVWAIVINFVLTR
jgi:hypothetical protein